MGYCGTKLYDSDLAHDIRNTYIDFLKIGKSNKEIVERIFKEYNFKFDDDPEKFEVYLILADTMWDYGRLDDDIKNYAIKIIDNDMGLDIWDGRLAEKRRKELSKLKEKILKEQPPEKKVKKIKKEQAFWNYHDILVYKITTDDCSDYEKKWVENSIYKDYYVVFQVEGIKKYNRGSLPEEYDNQRNVVSMYRKIFKKEPILNDIKLLCDDDKLYWQFDERCLQRFALFFRKKYVRKGYFKLLKREYEKYDENYNHICEEPATITADYEVNSMILNYINKLAVDNNIELIE